MVYKNSDKLAWSPVLYETVALTKDFPEHGLKKGDVGTLIDQVPHPHGGQTGFLVEFGSAEKVVIVNLSDIGPENSNG